MGGETFEKEDISMDILVEEVSKWSIRQNWVQPFVPLYVGKVVVLTYLFSFFSRCSRYRDLLIP